MCNLNYLHFEITSNLHSEYNSLVIAVNHCMLLYYSALSFVFLKKDNMFLIMIS